MGLRESGKYQYEGNGEDIEGAMEMTGLAKRISELRNWQREQQNRLNEQQAQQIQRLQEERQSIREMFQRNKTHVLQPEDCLATPNRAKTEGKKVPGTPKSWNTLVVPDTSPSQRIERADQLTSLLKKADLEVTPEDDEENTSDFDAIGILPKLSSGSEDEFDLKDESEVQSSNNEEELGKNNELNAPGVTRNTSRSRIPKFQYLRKGQSLTKFNLRAMKNPELCLGLKCSKINNLNCTDNSKALKNQSETEAACDFEPSDYNQILQQTEPFYSEVRPNLYKPIQKHEIELGLSKPIAQISEFGTLEELTTDVRDAETRSMIEKSLREFEVLEKASEDTSFRSTSSIVVKALQFKTLESKYAERTKTGLTNIIEISGIGDHERNNDTQQISVAEINERNLLTSSCAGENTKSLPIENRDSISTPIVFQDELSWHSANEEACGLSSASVNLSRDDFSPKSPPLSPTTNCIPSEFVAHYFTKLKSHDNEEKDGNDVIQNFCTIQSRMAEFEEEVEKFRKKNGELIELSNRQKIMQKKLEQEKRAFESYKKQEQQQMNRFLENEKQKMKKERELYGLYLKTRPQIEQHERKEMAKLKKEVDETKCIWHNRETKWTITRNRLQDRIRLVEDENKCLKNELQTVEKKNRDMAAELKNIQIKHCELTTEFRIVQQKNCDLTIELQLAQQKSSDLANELRLSQVKNYGLSSEMQRLNRNQPGQKPSFRSPTTSTEIITRPERPIPMPSKTEETVTSIWSDISEEESSYCNPEHVSHVDNRELFSLNPDVTIIRCSDKVVKTVELEDSSIEKIYNSGSREIIYKNNTRKEISKDGKIILVFLFNGDIKHILADEKIIYYFAENQTTHTTYPDGLQVYHFANNQLEKHYPDGSKQITFPDRSIKFIYVDGSEESVLEDGTRVQTCANGECMMQFPNGQKEIHTKDYKKRIFPDGTMKILYPDGKQETRYSNGRVRIKNKDGKLLLDEK